MKLEIYLPTMQGFIRKVIIIHFSTIILLALLQKNGTSSANDKNFLQVDQIGDDNKAGSWQEHNNSGTIYQGGDDNEASLYQHGGTAGPPINTAVISQTGDLNKAKTKQFGGGNNTATSYVTGNQNDYDLTCTAALDAVDLDGLPAAGAFSQWQNGSGHTAELLISQVT